MFTRRLAPALLLGLLFAACTPRAATVTAPSAPPAITVVRLTATPVALTDLPAAPTETPSPTPEPPCANDLRFIADVTVPDGTQFQPGAQFVKKWAVVNAGTCDWGVDHRLVFTRGDSLGAPSEIALYPAKAGTTVTLEIPMRAPASLGQYASRWQARDPAGNFFGEQIFVKIEVSAAAGTPTP